MSDKKTVLKKKKSIFGKLSFRKKKSGEARQETADTADFFPLVDTTQLEKSVKSSKNNEVTSSSHDRSNLDFSVSRDNVILTSLDIPSCFMPGVNVSDFPTTKIYQQALKANKENLKNQILSLGEDHPEVNASRLHTAEVYKGLGRMQEAVELINEVIKSCSRSDKDSVLLPSAMNDLALVYATLHKYDEAEDLLHKSVKILSQTVEADQAVVWGNIAVTLRNSKKISKAIPMHELAVKTMDAILGKDSPEALFQRGQLAVTLKKSASTEDNQRGNELLNEVVAQLDDLGYGKSHVWIKNLLQ